MTLGIYAPYRRDEVTTSALRLADLALSLGLSVRLVAPGRIDRPVHPYWDKRVGSVRKKNAVYRWAKGCTHLMWFEHDLDSLNQANLVAEKATRIFVPMWHRMPPTDAEEDWPYKHVVCAGHDVYRTLHKNIYEGETLTPLTECLWTSGLDPIKRKTPLHSDSISFYGILDSVTMDESGPFALRVVDEILQCHPQAYFTLDCGKSWPKRSRKELARLLATYEGRLKAIYNTTLIEQQHNFHQHDWTWLPSTRANTGVYAQRALACGTPVIVPDVSPFSEFVTQEQHGLLVECDLAPNWVEAPIAGLRLTSMLHAIIKALSRETLTTCLKYNWKLEEREKTFKSFWADLWDLELS